jgi:hypothetical protein
MALRGLRSGAGLKPADAAAIKSRGGERSVKRFPAGNQVSIKKMSESEPFDNASLNVKRCQNQARVIRLGRIWRVPDDWPDDNRCRGGMSLIQASIRNMGTWPAMPREKTSCVVAARMNTEALDRGGVVRSSDEGSVMGLERRGDTIGAVAIEQPVVGMMTGRIQ